MPSANMPAVILAGGRSQRMGVPDKCLLQIGSESMLSRIIATLKPQVGSLLINSNSNPERFKDFDVPVRGDVLPGRLGPLAGVLTAMTWAKEIGYSHVVTVPGDVPFLPDDLIVRMKAAGQYRRPVIVASGDRIHPTIGLWPVELAERLAQSMNAGVARMLVWCKIAGAVELLYPTDNTAYFSNLNTMTDLARAYACHGANGR